MTLLKRDCNTRFSEYFKIFKNTYFAEHLRTAASETAFSVILKKKMIKKSYQAF